MSDNEFYEPSSATNFLNRYHSVRREDSKPKAQVSPKLNPISASPSSERVWTSVFHPLGRAPTGKSRYDYTSKPSGSGESTSEMIEKQKSTKILNLDNPDE
uniref:Uncharacterized protein n=1 Tax=Noctiluca scintillans TaxID=2966 RepID=A0A7S1A5N9_NOCSC